MKPNLFLVLGTEGAQNSWNVHRVNLSRLPAPDNKAKGVGKSFNTHMGSMISSRERPLKKKHDGVDVCQRYTAQHFRPGLGRESRAVSGFPSGRSDKELRHRLLYQRPRI
jgi:hypothetical protein